MDHPNKRKLKIDLNDLESVFDNGDWQMNFYLDTQTGQIALVNDDLEYSLNSVRDELEAVDAEGPDRQAAFQAILERGDVPEWAYEPVLTAYEIESDILGSRFVEVPHQNSRDGYRDMEEFIETVQNERLQERLRRAIDGRGAFRAFRNELYDLDDERQRWHTFHDARLRERMLEWLTEEGIEPITK